MKENIKDELKANLFQKAVESRWTLEHHLLPEIYKNNVCPEFFTYYVVVMDKVRVNPLDTMEQIQDGLAKIYRKNNLYENMEASVKRLYCESKFGKKAVYDKVLIYSVQDFEQRVVG